MPLLKSSQKKLPHEISSRVANPVDEALKIQCSNPENVYQFDAEELGRGKFSVVKKVTHKTTNEIYVAKIIKFDSESLKFAVREYDLMAGFKVKDKVNKLSGHPGLVELHEAYCVRKYLILIMELVDGKSLLEFAASKDTITEDDVAKYVKQILEVLQKVHSMNFVHLDLRPTNMRFSNARQIRLLDYNSARFVPNKKAGSVVDIIGDTEFCAPEMLNFERVSDKSDIWALAVHMYILLSGISPFYNENEEIVVSSVQNAKWSFCDEFQFVSAEAKDFIKKCLIRAPESRKSAEELLSHAWLDDSFSSNRKNKVLDIKDILLKTDRRLKEEEEEEYVDASLVFRTFDEEEHISSEEEEEDDEE